MTVSAEAAMRAIRNCTWEIRVALRLMKRSGAISPASDTIQEREVTREGENRLGCRRQPGGPWQHQSGGRRHRQGSHHADGRQRRSRDDSDPAYGPLAVG